jgi:2-keto-4-pentenoate hydratase/2-oxohepta-3-ene-1,7-dioic acid hydratase in catechol pathway
VKLLRYGPPGQEKPGLLDAEGRLRDLSGVIGDVGGEALLPGSLARLAALDPSDLPAVSGTPRLGPCVAGVGKFPAVGLNYADHAKETGGQAPREPIIFTKMTSSICGPNDDTVIPRASVKTDWEVELGVVIGTPGKYIAEADALAHIAGYCVVDDVSEREYQLERKGQWVKGKSADSFGPIGPWLVTADEVPDPQTLGLWCEVDGARRQDGTTANMIFGVAFLVSYISRFMSFQPGDIIATGTPAGVGLGMKPPTFLAPGQRVRLGVEGLGEQDHWMVADD